MSVIHNILVAVDFSKSDEMALSQALQMGLKFGAKVWIVHVSMPDVDFATYEIGLQFKRDKRAKALHDERKILKQYADNMHTAGVAADSLLIKGPTAETILAEIERLGINLLIMAVHKHGFFYRLFGEMNPHDLAIKSNIPWLIVPEKKKK